MTAYYNENDPAMAAWLRELIKDGHIAPGEVDERSIEDIRPGDIRGFTQCHFFAGIGGWSVALRLADWPDNKPVWTGSCPCQPYSSAGKGAGFADERHLWPAWYHLIDIQKPPVIFGEQVDKAIRHGWLSLVQADLEAINYAVGSAVIPAASVGAPHARHRVWFVADSPSDGRLGQRESGTSQAGSSARSDQTRQLSHRSEGCSDVGRLEHTNSSRRTPGNEATTQARHGNPFVTANWTDGYWANADWIPCTDGKWRPIEPGVFPLATGVQERVAILRGVGNSIVPQVGAEFIKAYLEVRQ